MKVESDKQIAEVAISGNEMRVTFNQEQVEREDLDGSKRTVYVGEQVVVSSTASKAEITEAIVAAKYSLGAEIAMTRKADSDPEKQAYLAHVETGKVFAEKAEKEKGKGRKK